MPLQNRVTPFGDLVAVPERGMLMGNRGVLHDGERRIVRFSQGRRWICCLTSFFKDRRRRRSAAGAGEVEVLTPRSIVAAIAAGYEPVLHPTARGG